MYRCGTTGAVKTVCSAPVCIKIERMAKVTVNTDEIDASIFGGMLNVYSVAI